MKHLQLKKPLVFLDLETTGTNTASDRIVEIALVKILPGGAREVFETRINPERSIPAVVSRIHGITDADVADKPTFRETAGRVAGFIEGCDLAGFNIIRFDIPLLIEECRRAGIELSLEDRSLVDAQVIFHKKEPRSLEAAVQYYCEREHVNAHSALGDVEATIDILDAQLARYKDVPADAEALHNFCDQKNPNFVDRFGKMVWKDGEVCMNFGPHRGKLLRDIIEKDATFLDWMLRKDFSVEVKRIISDAMMGNYPSPPGDTEEPAAPLKPVQAVKPVAENGANPEEAKVADKPADSKHPRFW
ncbi:MAG: 3'-5' exonuclease [Nitrospirae bacterium]|nr:3'-5' exonuclease [Nitrospirota bacterium]